MRATADEVIRHNVARYPVDARGLSATARSGDASRPPPSASVAFGRNYCPSSCR
jgi:hypothetical protein